MSGMVGNIKINMTSTDTMIGNDMASIYSREDNR